MKGSKGAAVLSVGGSFDLTLGDTRASTLKYRESRMSVQSQKY